MANTNPVDSAAKVILLGSSVQITPAANPFGTAKVIGLVEQIQDPVDTALARCRVKYLEPSFFTYFEEWQAAADCTVIQYADGTAPA